MVGPIWIERYVKASGSSVEEETRRASGALESGVDHSSIVDAQDVLASYQVKGSCLVAEQQVYP